MNTTSAPLDNNDGRSMDLAIEKAYRSSPYIGIGCVIVDGDKKIAGSLGNLANPQDSPLCELLSRVEVDSPSIFLTQEPFLLDPAVSEKMLGLIEAGATELVKVSCPAPHPYTGQWLQTLESRGINTRLGDCDPKLALQYRTFQTWCAHQLPWITCMVMIDENGAAVPFERFHKDFGFSLDIGNRIKFHSAVIQQDLCFSLEEYYVRHELDKLDFRHEKPVFHKTGDDIAEDRGWRNILECCRQHYYFAVLVPLAPAQLKKLANHHIINELVVYQVNNGTLRSGDAEPALPIPDNFLTLYDCSPIGENLRITYRSTFLNEPDSHGGSH